MSNAQVTMQYRKDGKVESFTFVSKGRAAAFARQIGAGNIVAVIGATVEELVAEKPLSPLEAAQKRVEIARKRFEACVAELRRIRSKTKLRAMFERETLAASLAAEDELDAALEALRAAKKEAA